VLPLLWKVKTTVVHADFKVISQTATNPLFTKSLPALSQIWMSTHLFFSLGDVIKIRRYKSGSLANRHLDTSMLRLKFCLAVKNANFGQLSLNTWQPADFVTFHLSNLIQSDSIVKADDCRISDLISCT
jgi:hypothetical protein